MTYQEIKYYIKNVLDANHIPSITPQIGMLLNNGDKSLFYDEAESNMAMATREAKGGTEDAVAEEAGVVESSKLATAAEDKEAARAGVAARCEVESRITPGGFPTTCPK